MADSTNTAASSSTTPNAPSLPESSPQNAMQSDLIKTLSGLLRGGNRNNTVDPAMTQQMVNLVQTGKISQRHVLQVARI